MNEQANQSDQHYKPEPNQVSAILWSAFHMLWLIIAMQLTQRIKSPFRCTYNDHYNLH